MIGIQMGDDVHEVSQYIGLVSAMRLPSIKYVRWRNPIFENSWGFLVHFCLQKGPTLRPLMNTDRKSVV